MKESYKSLISTLKFWGRTLISQELSNRFRNSDSTGVFNSEYEYMKIMIFHYHVIFGHASTFFHFEICEVEIWQKGSKVSQYPMLKGVSKGKLWEFEVCLSCCSNSKFVPHFWPFVLKIKPTLSDSQKWVNRNFRFST